MPTSPAPSETGYPTLLEFPSPRLPAYAKETVVAEKLQALVKLGNANTLMKDFYDLETLSRTFAFEGKTRRSDPFYSGDLSAPNQTVGWPIG
jgi:predicted nucleotidyltransferase component of viral defense system